MRELNEGIEGIDYENVMGELREFNHGIEEIESGN